MFDKINNIASKKLIYLFKCHSIILLVCSNQPVPTAHKCYHPHPLNNTLDAQSNTSINAGISCIIAD